MDYKKTKAANTTVSRDLNELENVTGNVYESLMVPFAVRRRKQRCLEGSPSSALS
jgi:hypothetical protein